MNEAVLATGATLGSGFPIISPNATRRFNSLYRNLPEDTYVVLHGALRARFKKPHEIENALLQYGLDVEGRVWGKTVSDKAVWRPSEEGIAYSPFRAVTPEVAAKLAARAIRRCVERVKPEAYYVVDGRRLPGLEDQVHFDLGYQEQEVAYDEVGDDEDRNARNMADQIAEDAEKQFASTDTVHL